MRWNYKQAVYKPVKFKPKGKLKPGTLLWDDILGNVYRFIKYSSPGHALVEDFFTGEQSVIKKQRYRLAGKREIAWGVAKRMAGDYPTF